MSQYRNWIKADELMKRWELTPHDLADYVIEGKLTAYHRNKKPIDIDFEQKSFTEKLKYYREIYGEPTTWMGIVDLSYLQDRIINYLFNYKEVVDIESQFDSEKKLKLRPVQRHREDCRRIAKSIWQKNPNLTIATMIKTDEINKIRREKKTKPYSEKIIRGWIHDLCPDPKPGRPKTK